MQLVMAGDDGSAAAANAVDWATRFVAEREARLLVVRVAGTGQDAPGDVPVDGVTIVNESHPASGIMVAAHDRDADLIVLGRRGSGGFPRCRSEPRPITSPPRVDDRSSLCRRWRSRSTGRSSSG